MSKSHKRTNASRKSYAQPNYLIDVVIPVYGRFDLFQKCLDALPNAMGDLSYKVIIFDNGSSAKEADDFYKTINPKYLVIRNPHNSGFPRACNFGVKKGNSPLIFLLNTDVILEPNSIEYLVQDMDDPQIGVVGMLLTFPDDLSDLNPMIRPAGKVQHVGLSTNVRGELVHHLIGWSANNPRVLNQREVLMVTGAALMTRRSLWNKFKGFDEVFGLGTYEECDFQMKVHEEGLKVIVETKSKGIHYTGATAETYRIGYPLNQNKAIFLSKWVNKLTYTEIWSW